MRGSWGWLQERMQLDFKKETTKEKVIIVGLSLN